MAAVASPYLRRTISRRHSPLAAQKVGDSSDDEDLAPIKLSAEAEELLGEEDAVVRSARRDIKSLQEEHRRKLRESLSPRVADGSPAPRAVKLGSGSRPTMQGTLGRDGSFMYRNNIQATTHQPQAALDSITPAPRIRRVRVSGSRSQTRSPPASSTASNEADSNPREEKGVSETSSSKTPGSGEQVNVGALSDAAPVGPSTIMRPRRADENLGQSTMRVKRTLLRGPVRRGMIRRPSDEDDVNNTNDRDSPDQPASEPREGLRDPVDPISEEQQPQQDSPVPQRKTRPPEQHHHHASFASSPTAVPSEAEPQDVAAGPRAQDERPRSPQAIVPHPSSRLSGKRVQPIFKVPPLPPLPSARDQENEPPPTFKKSKPCSTMLGEVKKVSVLSDARTNASRTPQTASPERKPLAPRSQNTPHRPAPAPPPKMSMVEAATSTAGSARKKKINIMMNGRMYSRLDCIGRGGSSRVYRVMAENYKMFALKRVSLEEADSAAIAGYRGEIDLLKKLENVERVVRLFDYEVNEEKGTLCVLMEMGEADFNQMLNKQLKNENARLDVSFTRHYWKEMLECVHAVHQYDIVHSDLKPANFLLAQGRLKLIDFGIANAIQDDTVNVHRENQVRNLLRAQILALLPLRAVGPQQPAWDVFSGYIADVVEFSDRYSELHEP